MNNLALHILTRKRHDPGEVEGGQDVAVGVEGKDLVGAEGSAGGGDSQATGGVQFGESILDPVVASPFGVLEDHWCRGDDAIHKVRVLDFTDDDTTEEVGDVLDVWDNQTLKDPTLGRVWLHTVADTRHG